MCSNRRINTAVKWLNPHFTPKTYEVRSRDAVGRVPAFQPGASGSISGGIRNFNSILGLGASLACVLFCDVSSGRPDIVLTTHSGRPAIVFLSSVLVHSQVLRLQESGSRIFGMGGSPGELSEELVT